MIKNVKFTPNKLAVKSFFRCGLIFITVSALSLPVHSGEGGGRDPSLTKSISKLNCDELQKALNRLKGDIKHVNDKLTSSASLRDAGEYQTARTREILNSVKAKIKAQTNKAGKEKYSGELKAARKDYRAAKAYLRSGISGVYDANLAFDDIQERRDVFEGQRKVLGC